MRSKTWHDYLSDFEEIRLWEQTLQERREQANPHLWRKTSDFKPVSLDYDDGFASDKVRLNVLGAKEFGHAQRLTLYGSEWFDVCEAVLAWASDRLLKKLITPNLGQFTAVTDEELTENLRLLTASVKTVEEGSEDWLCYAIYFRVLELSNLYTNKAQQALTFASTFALGGLVRQLQLSHDNKTDAIARKKAKRALKNSTHERTLRNAESRKEAERRHAHAQRIVEDCDSGQRASVLARRIRSLWHKYDNAPEGALPDARTIENWLSAKKVSRARS